MFKPVTGACFQAPHFTSATWISLTDCNRAAKPTCRSLGTGFFQIPAMSFFNPFGGKKLHTFGFPASVKPMSPPYWKPHVYGWSQNNQWMTFLKYATETDWNKNSTEDLRTFMTLFRNPQRSGHNSVRLRCFRSPRSSRGTHWPQSLMAML